MCTSLKWRTVPSGKCSSLRAYRCEQSCKEVLATVVYHVKENSRRRCPALFLSDFCLSFNQPHKVSLALCVQPSYRTQNFTSQKWFTVWRCGIDATTPGPGPHHVGPRGWTVQAVVAFGHSPLSMVPHLWAHRWNIVYSKRKTDFCAYREHPPQIPASINMSSYHRVGRYAAQIIIWKLLSEMVSGYICLEWLGYNSWLVLLLQPWSAGIKV